VGFFFGPYYFGVWSSKMIKLLPQEHNPNINPLDKSLLLRTLADRWPSTFVSRDKIESFTGGIITAGYIANLDCLKKGPVSIHVGRKVAYPVSSLIQWLSDRVK
jgi:hypothetical protein